MHGGERVAGCYARRGRGVLRLIRAEIELVELRQQGSDDPRARLLPEICLISIKEIEGAGLTPRQLLR